MSIPWTDPDAVAAPPTAGEVASAAQAVAEITDLESFNAAIGRTTGLGLATLTGGKLTPSQMPVFATPSGLHGDGVTDDSATINAFLVSMAAAGGGTCYLPRSRYLCNNPIVLQTNTRLLGDGPTSTLVAPSGTIDSVVTNDPLAFNYGGSHLGIDGRSYFGGVSHGVHCLGDTSGADGVGGVPALQAKFVPSGHASTYGWLGADPSMPPDSPIGMWDHIYIFHTGLHSVFLDTNCRGQFWSNIYALVAGGPSGGGVNAMNLVMSSATDCFFNNLCMGCGYNGSIYLDNTGDVEIANSKFWNPGLYFNSSTGAQEVRAKSQALAGILIQGLGHALISNCEVQDVPGLGLWISGSYGNKVDLMTEDCAFADVQIDGASHDNDLDIRGRSEGVFTSGQTAGIIYSGSTLTGPNRVKYRRDSGYMTGGVPLYALQASAPLAAVNGLNLGDRGYSGVLTATTWAPVDLQSVDTWFYSLAASSTLTLSDLPSGTAAPGQEICFVVVQAGGSSLAYGTTTWYSKPTLPATAGNYTFRFRNMSSSATPFWVQV